MTVIAEYHSDSTQMSAIETREGEKISYSVLTALSGGRHGVNSYNERRECLLAFNALLRARINAEYMELSLPMGKVARPAAINDQKTFNHAYTIAFSIEGSTCPQGNDVTEAKACSAAIGTILRLVNEGQLLSSMGAPFDSYEEEHSPTPSLETKEIRSKQIQIHTIVSDTSGGIGLSIYQSLEEREIAFNDLVDTLSKKFELGPVEDYESRWELIESQYLDVDCYVRDDHIIKLDYRIS